jgi:hypothetical protein
LKSWGENRENFGVGVLSKNESIRCLGKELLPFRSANEKVQQLVGQIPWGRNILIFRKIKDLKAAEFYLLSTIVN